MPEWQSNSSRFPKGNVDEHLRSDETGGPEQDIGGLLVPRPLRILSPHTLGKKKGHYKVLSIQTGGDSLRGGVEGV